VEGDPGYLSGRLGRSAPMRRQAGNSLSLTGLRERHIYRIVTPPRAVWSLRER
jgi:hypothetical protein